MSGVEKIIAVIVVLVLGFGLLRACSAQSITKNWGGEMDVSLEPNQKLVEVTWKDDSMWFLTKEMTDVDIAENYKFYEKDVMGILEGCVNISETKMTEEEYEEYQNLHKYETDYYNSSNFDNNGEPVFIGYNMDTNEYYLIKPYNYNDNYELVPSY